MPVKYINVLHIGRAAAKDRVWGIGFKGLELRLTNDIPVFRKPAKASFREWHTFRIYSSLKYPFKSIA